MSTGGGPEGTNRDLVTSKIHVFWNLLGKKKNWHTMSKKPEFGNFRGRKYMQRVQNPTLPRSRNWGVAHCHQQSKNDYFAFIQDGGASICLLFSSLPGEMIRFVCGSTTK